MDSRRAQIQVQHLPTKPALSELDLAGAIRWAEQESLPAYRGRQLYHALSKRGVQDAQELTEFPQCLRESIAARFETRAVCPKLHLTSKMDRSEKVLFALHDGHTIETVLIRAGVPGGSARNTVCVSSQVGCPAACTFCATGLGGFARNLSAAEIADQVMYFVAALRRQGERVTNIVYMGMGEPLLNVKSVPKSVEVFTRPDGFGLGDRHITVSTVGIVPQLRRFAEWAGQVNLAVSLHAPNDALRTQLVPYNARFPIPDLMDAVREYIAATRRRVSFEYVLLKNVNDSRLLAEELATLLSPLKGLAHVNLIPWNPFREGRFIRSEGPDADAFARTLRSRAVNATIRYSKGLDISAACGQLREEYRGPVPAVALRPAEI